MDEKEFDYEEYRNNMEQAAEIHDRFYRIRNILIYFVLYSVLYSFVFGSLITNGLTISKMVMDYDNPLHCSLITNGLTIFISLVAVYLFAKVVTYLFDEIRFSIRTIIKNHRRRKKK